MSPPTPSPAGDSTPPPISPGGTYSIQASLFGHSTAFFTVSVGCKIYIRRPGPDGEEERLAEILSIRDKPVNSYGRRSAAANAPATPEDQWEFFVHWDSFNKRLDEWVLGSRLVLSRDLEWPRPKTTGGKKAAGPVQKAPGKAPRSLLKKATTNAALAASPTPGSLTPMLGEYAPSPSPAPPSLKRKTRPDDEEEEEEEEEEDAEGDMDAEGEMDVDGDGEIENFELSLQESVPEPPPLSSFSKEQEIEKLRTTGSMTQSVSEIARVKNLNRLQIGKHEVDAWYFSPYPKEYAHLPAQRDSTGCHLIGYFSKEKESAENYNVACLLTLPQHQRHGYGKLLIEFSYELSKKEQKLGSPEKPLSDLGLLGYRAYWAETIIDLLLECTDGELSVDDIAQRTSITHADVMNTLVVSLSSEKWLINLPPTRCTTLQLFKHFKGQHILCLNNAVLEKHQKNKAKRRRRIHPECLRWKPPVFTRDQLRFGW
ncbi:hypothetical protein DXG01_013619 [Tephrocybe rancida]|nr:hypothetical protein DXG01_013619 [Tephrocybe rancida]